jgi:hypothetical protein
VREKRNARGRSGYSAICEHYNSVSRFVDIWNQLAFPRMAMTLCTDRDESVSLLSCSCYYYYYYYYYLVCEAIGTSATPGLLCQPQVIVKMIVEKQMECRLPGETEVLEENLPQLHFCPSQNPT